MNSLRQVGELHWSLPQQPRCSYRRPVREIRLPTPWNSRILHAPQAGKPGCIDPASESLVCRDYDWQIHQDWQVSVELDGAGRYCASCALQGLDQAEWRKYVFYPRPNRGDEVLTSAVPFLYGGNVVKAHVGRWSEDCPEHSGVVVYSMVRSIWNSRGEFG